MPNFLSGQWSTLKQAANTHQSWQSIGTGYGDIELGSQGNRRKKGGRQVRKGGENGRAECSLNSSYLLL